MRGNPTNVYDRSQLMRAMHTIMEREKYQAELGRPESYLDFCHALVDSWPGPSYRAQATLDRCPPKLPPGTLVEDYRRLPHDPSFDGFREIARPAIDAGWVRGFIWPNWSTLAWVHYEELTREVGDLVAAWRASVLLGGPR